MSVSHEAMLTRAVAQLGAQALSDDVYAVRFGIRYRLVSADEMRHLASVFDGEHEDEIEEQIDAWAATLDGSWLPLWWSPELRFAVVTGSGKRVPQATLESALEYHQYHGRAIVTVSLETGEEINA